MNNIIQLAVPANSTPDTVNGKVTPRRKLNSEVREREHLTQSEVNQVLKAAREAGRHGIRDYTMLLLAYRHGLRVSELVALKWSQLDLSAGTLHVNRKKRGTASTHPITGDEMRVLRRLQRDYPDSPYMFTTERRTPLTTSGVRKIVTRAGKQAGLPFPIHPHMLRHACGYKLANDGIDTRAIQHYLGHKNIQHTVRYTALSADRFKGFWD